MDHCHDASMHDQRQIILPPVYARPDGESQWKGALEELSEKTSIDNIQLTNLTRKADAETDRSKEGEP